MASSLDSLSEWTPAVTVGILFIIAIGGTTIAVSSMMADLVGLVYLLASPIIYQGIDSVISTDETNTAMEN